MTGEPLTPPRALDDRYEHCAGMVQVLLDRGYSQTDIAEKCGVSRRTVHAWKNKESLPSDEHYGVIHRLVGAHGESPGYRTQLARSLAAGRAFLDEAAEPLTPPRDAESLVVNAMDVVGYAATVEQLRAANARACESYAELADELEVSKAKRVALEGALRALVAAVDEQDAKVGATNAVLKARHAARALLAESTPKGGSMSALSYDERLAAEQERRDQLLALPIHTLVRLGWMTPSGRVQGGIFYRVGDGLGPTGRDSTPRDVLRREVERSHMPHAHQRWDIEILANPAAESTPKNPEARGR